jgi:hypothetical protein
VPIADIAQQAASEVWIAPADPLKPYQRAIESPARKELFDRDAGYEARRANSPERASPEIRLEESAARLRYRRQLLKSEKPKVIDSKAT